MNVGLPAVREGKFVFGDFDSNGFADVVYSGTVSGVGKVTKMVTWSIEERLKQEIEENPALDTGKEESDDFDGDLENEFDDDGTEKIDTEDINIFLMYSLM